MKLTKEHMIPFQNVSPEVTLPRLKQKLKNIDVDINDDLKDDKLYQNQSNMTEDEIQFKNLLGQFITLYNINDIEVKFRSCDEEKILYDVYFSDGACIYVFKPKDRKLFLVNRTMDKDNFADVMEDTEEFGKEDDKKIGVPQLLMKSIYPRFENENIEEEVDETELPEEETEESINIDDMGIEEEYEDEDEDAQEGETDETEEELDIGMDDDELDVDLSDEDKEIGDELDEEIDEEIETEDPYLKKVEESVILEGKKLEVIVDKKDFKQFQDIIKKNNYFFNKRLKQDGDKFKYTFPDNNPDVLEDELQDIFYNTGINIKCIMEESFDPKGGYEQYDPEDYQIKKVVKFPKTVYEVMKQFSEAMIMDTTEVDKFNKEYFNNDKNKIFVNYVATPDNDTIFGLDDEDINKNTRVIPIFYKGDEPFEDESFDYRYDVKYDSEDFTPLDENINNNLRENNMTKYEKGEMVKIDLTKVSKKDPLYFKQIRNIYLNNKGYAMVVEQKDNGQVYIVISGKYVSTGGLPINENAIIKLNKEKTIVESDTKKLQDEISDVDKMLESISNDNDSLDDDEISEDIMNFTFPSER